MKPGGKLTRRSFLGRVAGASFVGAAGLVTGAQPAEALQRCSDNDTGRNADPINRGRRCGSNRPRSCTDGDTGRYGDPIGRGRRCATARPDNCSDGDLGRNGDPAGRGRRCNNNNYQPQPCSDSDTGRNADPGGQGRRCNGGNNNARPYTGYTDQDSGAYRDEPNYGRGRQRPTCSDSDTGNNSDPAGRGRRCS